MDAKKSIPGRAARADSQCNKDGVQKPVSPPMRRCSRGRAIHAITRTISNIAYSATMGELRQRRTYQCQLTIHRLGNRFVMLPDSIANDALRSTRRDRPGRFRVAGRPESNRWRPRSKSLPAEAKCAQDANPPRRIFHSRAGFLDQLLGLLLDALLRALRILNVHVKINMPRIHHTGGLSPAG